MPCIPAHGHLPTNLDEVNEREKDIRYASRTMFTTDTLREKHDVRYEPMPSETGVRVFDLMHVTPQIPFALVKAGQWSGAGAS